MYFDIAFRIMNRKIWVLLKASSTFHSNMIYFEHIIKESQTLSTHSWERKQMRQVITDSLLTEQLYRPEMHRSICTIDDMGLACVNFSVKPVGQCLYWSSVCISNSHIHFHLITFLEVGTPDFQHNWSAIKSLVPVWNTSSLKLKGEFLNLMVTFLLIKTILHKKLWGGDSYFSKKLLK